MTAHSRGAPSRPSRLYLCLAALLVGFSGACSGAEPSQETPREASSYFDGAVALPFDPYFYDEEARSKRNQLVGDKLAECMAEAGVQYSPPPYAARRLPRIYGIVSAADAGTFGYRPPRTADAPDSSEIDTQTAGLLYGSAENTVTVRDTGGTVVARYDPESCVYRAALAVQPDWREVLQIEARMDRYVSASLADAQEDPRLAEGWERWSACMAERGFEFDDPWDTFYSVWPGVEPEENEIETAKADVACKLSTNLLTVWSESIADAQDSLLLDDAQARSDWSRWLELSGDWRGQ